MARQELVSPEGLRLDGRRPTELRSFTCDINVLQGKKNVDGSALFEIGGSKVLASVMGPREALDKTLLSAEADQGFLSVRIHAAAFSSAGGERRARNERRLLEWSRLVEGTFASAMMTDTFPRSLVDVFVEVLNADGSVLSAIVNAVNLAVIDAGIPMRDHVVAVTVAYAQDTLLLDPNRMEESTAASASVTLAYLARTNHVIMTTAEPRMHADKLGALMRLASQGAEKIFQSVEKDCLRPHLAALFSQKTALMSEH